MKFKYAFKFQFNNLQSFLTKGSQYLFFPSVICPVCPLWHRILTGIDHYYKSRWKMTKYQSCQYLPVVEIANWAPNFSLYVQVSQLEPQWWFSSTPSMTIKTIGESWRRYVVVLACETNCWVKCRHYFLDCWQMRCLQKHVLINAK